MVVTLSEKIQSLRNVAEGEQAAKARVEQAFLMHQRREQEIQHMLQDEINNLRRLNIKLAAEKIQGAVEPHINLNIFGQKPARRCLNIVAFFWMFETDYDKPRFINTMHLLLPPILNSLTKYNVHARCVMLAHMAGAPLTEFLHTPLRKVTGISHGWWLIFHINIQDSFYDLTKCRVLDNFGRLLKVVILAWLIHCFSLSTASQAAETLQMIQRAQEDELALQQVDGLRTLVSTPHWFL